MDYANLDFNYIQSLTKEGFKNYSVSRSSEVQQESDKH